MTVLEIVQAEAEVVDEELESDLPWLHAQVLGIGRPKYYCSEDGTWHASVIVPTDRASVRAEVSGTFNHPTLSAAIRNLLEKCR